MQPISHLPSSKPLHPQSSCQSSVISYQLRGNLWQPQHLLSLKTENYSFDSRQPIANMLKVNSRSAIGGFSKRC